MKKFLSKFIIALFFLFTPFFIWHEVLPQPWIGMNRGLVEPLFWWSVPMAFTLVVGSAVLAFYFIIEGL